MVPQVQASTTAGIRVYLTELAGMRGTTPAHPVVRTLLSRSVGRLHLLYATVLRQSYPRLTQAPLNLQAEDLLSSVVERLLKAIDGARPQSVLQFFALAN